MWLSNVPEPPPQLRMKHFALRKSCAINTTHERNPRQLLLVLLSEAPGGGRIALTLKKASDAFPKAASEPGGFFHVATLRTPNVP
ncbi:hypothetical protein [Stenotrophomonas lactitubi]|uniref:hypothetical protein n=1 Tax=Stenotrophomonas lactitubi TaxID=2045214 RepID=UPI00387772C0